MLNIGMVVYPGFQPLGLSVGTVFEYANSLNAPIYDFCLVSENGGPVRSSQGFSVTTSPIFEQQFDTLIVLGDNECAPQSDRLLSYLREAPKLSRRVAATCTGSFLLANAGLLDGRRATTHWYFAKSLKETHPSIVVEEDRIFVVDGQIWTSAGMSAGLDLALALVEKDLGSAAAKAIARKLVIYHRRGGGQSQFSVLLDFDAKSDRVQTALDFAKSNLRQELSVESLADAARLSPRQFSRVFREETGESPAKAVERLRVEAARLMIETTSHPIDVVARETGFGDRERMRQSFLRTFGQPPQAIRRASARAELL
ncbi:GlxA family transcriptional regulator [Bradyrhizobium sp. AUGA SZCCT0274]|uniref:GlxA family transcriptional regulator n=1 Tax=unclassified Bradyrhizobium TaxID=2631580 RepID=UPI001BA55F79|nr:MULTISPECIES: GlxA family transcriptional regulator [unclassified Bradyrhizobium]MBR1194190.1 GlxA family transcriptional regulator [Bradyrhizobium sp. AUGA SZCCT0160]MBR1243488.1 GlxA family transcriptional regulator [Bradyrhizobium sp. AUGA SZCCT0274]